MSRHPHPPTSRRPRSAGFTLIEAAVVVAIITIITSLGLAAYQNAGGAASPQNAAHDLSGALGMAHQRAVSTQHSVWLVVFPDRKKDGTAGNGVYYIFDDPDLTFFTTGGQSTGGLSYGTFAPPNVFPNTGVLAGKPNPLIKAVYLDEYTKKTVKFGVVPGPQGLTYGVPFNAVTPADCTFCTGSPRKGAILFDGEGRARFVDGNGAFVNPTGATAAGRSGGLGLCSRNAAGACDKTRQYLFAISGPTSYASFFQK
ncbi:MAG TPA: prepilin-type N-terminal cleavage/methylation domain-containing protein [Myxococcaceae bacterium]